MMVPHARRLLVMLALASAFAAPTAAQTRTVKIASKILGEDRVLHVTLPPNYAVARQRYEVAYLLDGHVREYFDLTVAAAGYDMIGDPHDYTMPPQIVVRIDQRDRGTDLGRNQELFTRFVTEEVVPFIDRTYRTSQYRTLIGHSLGGRFALPTSCRAPGVFPSVIAISAAGGDSTSADAVTRCLSSAFTSDTPLATIPPGLRFVYDKTIWEMPPAVADSVVNGRLDPERAIPAFYSALSARVDVTIAPTLKWMLVETHAKIRQLISKSRSERSVA